MLKTTVLAGMPFGLLMGLIFTLQSGHPLGLAFGLGAGLLFGLLLAAFTEWLRSRINRQAADLDGERVLKQGLANHFRGVESVGGWLYLTDRRLLFRSHRLNFQNHESSIPLEEVLEARVSSTAWIIPNGLRIVTAQGEDRFVVEGRRSWVDGIRQARGQPS